MPDVTATIANKTAIASGDYSAVDPAVVVAQRGAARSFTARIAVTLLSGAGCTVTVTLTDADTGAVLGSQVITAVGTYDKVLEPLPETVHRVAITCVGSGTRTTLTYSVTAIWPHLTYKSAPYWNGVAYVNPESHLH